MLYSINRPNFTVWLPSRFEMLDNMCIVIISCPGCDVINFEINLSFLIKPFFYLTNRKGQKSKYLRMKRATNMKQKAFFINFKGLSVVRKCLRCASGLYIS